MRLPEPPPLPTSQMNVEVWDSEVRGLHQANAAYFTAAQMREYALAYGAAVREECAKVCDAETQIAHGEFGAGWVEGARTCAAAIRKDDHSPTE